MSRSLVSLHYRLLRLRSDNVVSDFIIKQATFGAAEWSFNLPTGIMGGAMGKGYNQDYPSFIDEMHSQGLIKDKDFSVGLGSVGSDHGKMTAASLSPLGDLSLWKLTSSDAIGEIIFGGIDTGKFTGPLKGLPLTSQLSDREDVYFR